jgi:hypothetical protein
MRQAGLKPKSHKSGVYWTRATARTGRAKQTPDNAIAEQSDLRWTEIPPFILAIIILLYPFYFIAKIIYTLSKKS